MKHSTVPVILVSIGLQPSQIPHECASDLKVPAHSHSALTKRLERRELTPEHLLKNVESRQNLQIRKIISTLADTATLPRQVQRPAARGSRLEDSESYDRRGTRPAHGRRNMFNRPLDGTAGRNVRRRPEVAMDRIVGETGGELLASWILRRHGRVKRILL